MILRIITAAAALLLSAVFVILFKKNKISAAVMQKAVAATAAVFLTVFISTFFIGAKINVNGSRNLTVEVFDTYTDSGATAEYQGKNVTNKLSVSGDVDTSKIGDYIIEYSFVAGKHKYKAERTVHVVDTVAPQMALNGDENCTVSSLELFNDEGATATDNYDGDISAQIKTEIKKLSDAAYDVIYTVADTSGNTASVTRHLEIKDIVPPVITLNGGNVSVLLGGVYNDPGFSAKDDLDGDITDKVSVSGNVDTSVAGAYTLTYTVTDAAGNTATAKRTVTVYVPNDPSCSRICLTFDDGPSNDVTIRILDILKQNDVKATFFICNYSDDKIPILRRMIDEGHSIGIHGYSHDYAKIYANDDAFINNINSLRDKLKNDTGYTTDLMRFPGGSSNKVSKKYNSGIMTRLTKRVTADGWRYYDWNVSSGDASGNNIPAYKLIANFKSEIKKGRTNVILCHDISSKRTTADALQSMIDYGKANGYVFSAIDGGTPQCHHGVNN